LATRKRCALVGASEQAREVAGQLTEPGAKQAVLRLADSFDRLGRAALDPIPGEEDGVYDQGRG
jgi:hypothetical protein